MKRSRVIWTGSAVIALVWTVAALGIAALDSQLMTTQKVLRFVADHPLEGRSAQARDGIIEELAQKINRLPFDERQKMRASETARQFYAQMTDAERMRLIQLTMEEGLRQVMESFDKMTPVQRQRLVSRAMRDFREATGVSGEEALQEGLPPQALDDFVGRGLKRFMGDSGTVDSVQMQMFLEQLQHNMRKQRPRRNE